MTVFDHVKLVAKSLNELIIHCKLVLGSFLVVG